MSEWELWHANVECPGCGRPFRYVVQHPPIPRVVRGFYDEGDGRPVGDECPYCFETLAVPKLTVREESGEFVVYGGDRRLKAFTNPILAGDYARRIR